MNRNEFNRFIAGIDLPGPGDLEELRELIALFPWFHSAHMLLLRGLKENSDIRFDTQLKSSALSVNDREVLYHYLFLPAEAAAPAVDMQPAKEAVTEPEVEVAPEPAEEVVTVPDEEVAPQPAEEVVTVPAEEVAPQPAEEVVTVPDEEAAPQPVADAGQDNGMLAGIAGLVADELPADAELVIITEEAYSPEELTAVAEETLLSVEAPIAEEILSPEETEVPPEQTEEAEAPVSFIETAPLTDEAPADEYLAAAGYDEMVSAGDAEDSVATGSDEENVVNELPETEDTSLRTREELIAEIESRLKELEQIHRDVMLQEKESVGVSDLIPGQEPQLVTAPAEESLPDGEPILITGQTPAEEPVIASEQLPSDEPVPATGQTPSEESVIVTEQAPAAEPASAGEQAPSAEEITEAAPPAGSEDLLELIPDEFPAPEEATEPLILLESAETAVQPEPEEYQGSTESGQAPESEEPEEPLQPEGPYEPLESDEPEDEETDAVPLSPADLIERFIRISPRIERMTPGDYPPVRDLSEESSSEQGTFITETLAKIYINQGYYSKAINIYEKLSLQYPEKSAYFAGRIEKIKELIK